MKKIILGICLMSFFSIPAFAKSDCVEGEQNCWDCGKTENDLCTARKTGSELKITGSGEMKDYHWTPGGGPYGYGYTDVPWGYNYTSVSVEGVKNIGTSAFTYASITTVNIADSVSKIGAGAFSSCYSFQNISIPDSVTSIEYDAFGWAPYFSNRMQNLFIPDSVTFVDNAAFQYAQITTVYCAQTTGCPNSSPFKTYTKDQNGVYLVDGQYYASPDDMMDQSSCGFGNTAPQNCIDAAKAYQAQKAENMAGGALCQTTAGCLKLINMANAGTYCTTIASCKAYGDEHNISFGDDVNYQGKRIYTVDEATAVASPKGNTFIIRYR